MSVLQDIRCRLGRHRWGPVQGDDRGGHRTCGYCGRIQRVHTGEPPEAHDHLGLHP